MVPCACRLEDLIQSPAALCGRCGGADTKRAVALGTHTKLSALSGISDYTRYLWKKIVR
jgi:hypothetical protein